MTAPDPFRSDLAFGLARDAQSRLGRRPSPVTRSSSGRSAEGTGTGEPYEVADREIEGPGRHFHPLAATLITGAVWMTPALAEHIVTDAGSDRAFRDTDGIALAEPDDLEDATFHARADGVVDWFAALNPCAFGGSVLKVEDVIADPVVGRGTPLFCYALFRVRTAT